MATDPTTFSSWRLWEQRATHLIHLKSEEWTENIIEIYKRNRNGSLSSVIVHVFNVDNAHDAFISFGFVCAHALVLVIADT